jgi:hypothetical protein
VKELPSPLDRPFVLPCVRAEPFAIVTVAGFDEGLRVESNGIILPGATRMSESLVYVLSRSRIARSPHNLDSFDARRKRQQRFPAFSRRTSEKHAPLSIIERQSSPSMMASMSAFAAKRY